MELRHILYGSDVKPLSTIVVAKDRDDQHPMHLVAELPPSGEVITHPAFWGFIEDPDIPAAKSKKEAG